MLDIQSEAFSIKEDVFIPHEQTLNSPKLVVIMSTISLTKTDF